MALFLTGCVLPTLAGVKPPAPPPQIVAQIDQIFSAWDRPDSPGCALGVIQHGQLVYRNNYGMAEPASHTPISANTVFYIASMSKQFTAMSTLLLEEQGKLSLEDDIRLHIPDFPDYGHPITLGNLIHHTSGIPDYLVLWQNAGKGYADAGSIDEQNSLALLERQPRLDFTPGERYEYSNSNYFLLGIIVERSSGKSLREFARQNIFQPLVMTHTQYLDNPNTLIQNLAVGHVLDAQNALEPLKTAFHIVGDGGIYSTVTDLYHWDQNFYHNQLGKKSPGLIDLLYEKGTLNDGETIPYAAGEMVTTTFGFNTIEHGGGFIGYTSYLIRFPDQQLSVVLLCNAENIDVHKLSVQVAGYFLWR